MSALKPVVNMLVTLKSNQGIDAVFDNVMVTSKGSKYSYGPYAANHGYDAVSNNVGVGKKSFSTAQDGLILIQDMLVTTEFQIFFLTGKFNKLDLPWLLQRKPSDQLDIVLEVEMVEGIPINGQFVARTDMPDCRLVHMSRHDGGYIVTFLKKPGGGFIQRQRRPGDLRIAGGSGEVT